MQAILYLQVYLCLRGGIKCTCVLRGGTKCKCTCILRGVSVLVS